MMLFFKARWVNWRALKEKELMAKKIAMIIAPKDFRDEEYIFPKDIFQDKGIEVLTFSSKKGEAIGTYGGVVRVDSALGDLKAANFAAVVFIGGSGAVNYMQNDVCHKIAKDTVEKGKVLGAICIAPTILAKAGVLKDKKAVVWSSETDKSAVKILKQEGADFQARPVVVDGNIVTAEGPQAARRFAEEIVKLLK